MGDEHGETVVREIDIDATPETVFDFFVDSEKLTRWLAVAATLEPRPGGACIQEHVGDHRRPGRWEMRGEFVEVDRPTRVVFTWGFTDLAIGVPPGSSIVEVTLQPIASGTRVRLVHRRLPAAEVEDHARGWADMLDRLALAVLEGEHVQ